MLLRDITARADIASSAEIRGAVAVSREAHPVALPSTHERRPRSSNERDNGDVDYLDMSPAGFGADLLKQTRMFSRAVEELRADMERIMGKPAHNG